MQQETSETRVEEKGASVIPGDLSVETIASSLSATGNELQEKGVEAIEDTKAAVQSAAQQAGFKAQLLQRREARARYDDNSLTDLHCNLTSRLMLGQTEMIESSWSI